MFGKIDWDHVWGRAPSTALLAAFGAVIGYFTQVVLGAWKVLDPIANATGRWLNVNITGDQVGLTIALVVMLAIWWVSLQTLYRKHGGAPLISDPKRESSWWPSLEDLPQPLVTAHRFLVKGRAIELGDACVELHEALDRTPITERIKAEPVDILNVWGNSLLSHRVVYAIEPPSRRMRLLTDDEIESLEVWGKGSRLVDRKPTNKYLRESRFHSPVVFRRDLSRVKRELRSLARANALE